MIIKIIIALLIGYIFGLFQTSYIIGRILKIDIRKSGSGNLGATNATRILGVKFGAITYFFDALKGFLAALTIMIIYKRGIDIRASLELYAVLGAMIGHCFPFYLKFKGGKGISTMTGGMLLINPFIAIIGLVIFGFTIYFTKYVSVGSIVMSVCYMAMLSIGSSFEFFTISQKGAIHILFVSIIVLALVIYTHWINIQRLSRGTENKIGA